MLMYSIEQRDGDILFHSSDPILCDSVLALREAYTVVHPSAQQGQTEGHASQPEEEVPCDSSLFSLIMMEMEPFLPQCKPIRK